jgi:flagellin
MVSSINNNPGASAGVQHLNKTSSILDQIRERVATGKKVNSPKDDAAILAIAKQLEGQLAGVAAVRTNLAFGESVTGAAMAAGQEVSDLLIEAKAKAVQASQEGLDQASRDALQADLNSLTAQIDTVVQTSGFGGTNLVEQGAANLNVLASESGDTIAVNAADLSSAGLGVDSLSLASATDAQSALANIDTALRSTTGALASFGASAKRIQEQGTFTTQMSDTLKQGLGKLVDADMGAESAKLLAGEVRQRLGVQSLSIANAAPRNIASLFE